MGASEVGNRVTVLHSAGHTDTSQAHSALGPSKEGHPFLSDMRTQDGLLLAWVGKPICRNKELVATSVFPRREMGDEALGASFSKIVTRMGTNCFHTFSPLTLMTTS